MTAVIRQTVGLMDQLH